MTIRYQYLYSHVTNWFLHDIAGANTVHLLYNVTVLDGALRSIVTKRTINLLVLSRSPLPGDIIDQDSFYIITFSQLINAGHMNNKDSSRRMMMTINLMTN